MALTGYFAGVLSDMMIQSGISVTLTRKIMQVLFFMYAHIPFPNKRQTTQKKEQMKRKNGDEFQTHKLSCFVLLSAHYGWVYYLRDGNLSQNQCLFFKNGS